MSAVFYVGDAIEVLNKLPAKSVDLILTSPPFLALRSYLPADHPDKSLEGGSQATPGAYIDWLIDVVEACNRVLAPHGSMCIELGDTYAGSGGGGGDYLEGGWREGQQQFAGSSASMRESNAAHWRQKNQNATAWPLPKSLSLIPELFRLTLVYGQNPLTGRTTERWRLRNVIRWVRPNPPVGALGDKFRPATSELMVFCKSAKRYFDLDAVREPHTVPNMGPLRSRAEGTKGALHAGTDTGKTWDVGERMNLNPAGAPPLDWWNIPLLEGEEPTKLEPRKTGGRPTPKYDGNREPNSGDRGGGSFETHELGAPPLDWWNIPPGGYEGAHYAVWPPELLVKPIKAMCPEKVCQECGEPQRREVEREPYYTANGERTPGGGRGEGIAGIPAVGFGHTVASRVIAESWTDCGHNNWRPGLILDPFVGSGTTLAVATGHGRDAIGIDLDERNYELSLERVGPLILQRGEATV